MLETLLEIFDIIFDSKLKMSNLFEGSRDPNSWQLKRVKYRWHFLPFKLGDVELHASPDMISIN